MTYRLDFPNARHPEKMHQLLPTTPSIPASKAMTTVLDLFPSLRFFWMKQAVQSEIPFFGPNEIRRQLLSCPAGLMRIQRSR
jgi:hypothetical protein